MNNTCNAQGECVCKGRLIGGAKCDKCIARFFNFPNCQCKLLFNTLLGKIDSNTFSIIACGCNVQGVEKNDFTCDREGKCNCRCDVRGDKCDECEIGHHGFPKCTGKFLQTPIFNGMYLMIAFACRKT